MLPPMSSFPTSGRPSSLRAFVFLASSLAVPLVVAAACSSTTTGSSRPNDGLGGEGGEGGQGSGGGNTTASGGTGGRNTGGSNTGGSGPGSLACIESELTVGEVTEFDTSVNDDSYRASCGKGNSPEAAFEWTAPSTNYYAFDSAGSNFDTVVSVLDGDCDGDELACSNASGASPQGRAVAKVSKNQRVVVVVDGNLGESGDSRLEITPIECPTTDVSDQPLPATLTTVGGTNTHDGTCGGVDTPEKAIRYLAKSAGLYRFSASSAEFGPALYVEQGPECGGVLLQCNKNVENGHPAEVTRWLEAGEAVTLIVDGGEGAFTLDAQMLEDPGACAGLPTLTSISDVVLDESAPKLLSSSCDWAGNIGFDSQPHPYPEHAYTFTLDLGVAESCSIDVTGDMAFQGYLLRGDHCEGAQVDCELGSPDFHRSFSAQDNGTYTLVIENNMAFDSPITYSITTDC